MALGAMVLRWRTLRPSRRESMTQRAILPRSAEKEKKRLWRTRCLFAARRPWTILGHGEEKKNQRFTRSGNLYASISDASGRDGLPDHAVRAARTRPPLTKVFFFNANVVLDDGFVQNDGAFTDVNMRPQEAAVNGT